MEPLAVALHLEHVVPINTHAHPGTKRDSLDNSNFKQEKNAQEQAPNLSRTADKRAWQDVIARRIIHQELGAGSDIPVLDTVLGSVRS